MSWGRCAGRPPVAKEVFGTCLVPETLRAGVAGGGPDRWTTAGAAGRHTSIDALLKDIDGVPRKGSRPIQGRQSDGPVES
jgi:hypothetical protein